MLLCAVPDLPVGSVVAAPVRHPQRPEVELLAPGAALDQSIVNRLKQLGVETVWINHNATGDLNHVVPPNLTRLRHEAYEQIKADFARLESEAVSSSTIANYRRLVLELVCELIGNRHLAGLTEQLVGGSIFTHCSNVAYLSIVVGLDLESYIVSQRARASAEAARDLSGLGIGAMLHDLGKVGLPVGMQTWHAVRRKLEDVAQLNERETGPDDPRLIYRAHAQRGYQMLRNCRAPATATQVVLTHHQRWDGKGWPDMKEVTDERRVGAQAGERIHVFSRIVAAVNALDGLADRRGKRRPPVMALKALASERFDGWFDPIVRDRVLRVLPPFAMGSQVTLSDGRAAVVMTPNLEQPCRPTVRLLSEADRLPDGRYPLLDLGAIGNTLHICRCAGEEVEKHLFTLPEPLHWHRQAGADETSAA